MTLDITAETTVRRPRDEVFAYMADPANDPAWIGGLKEVRLVGDPPIGVGSRVQRVASFMGRRIEYLNEVVELAPGRVLDMKSVKAPFPMRITYSFDDEDGATRVRNRVRGGRGRLSSRLMAPMVRRNVQRDLDALRDVLEAGR